MKHEHRRRSSPAPLVVGALTLATLMAAVAILDVDVEASHRSNASRIASDATSRTTSQAVQAPPSLPPEPTSTSAPATTTSPPARARRIAFSSNRNWPDGPLALFTMNPDGTDITLVVAYSQSHGDEGPVEPSWSPDQSHLAYTLAPTINKNPPCSYNRTIYISDSAGGAQRQLLPTRTCGTYDHQATWSPDGTLIAYVETSARGPIISQLRAVRPDGTGDHAVTTPTPDGLCTAQNNCPYNLGDHEPGFSPDSHQLVYTGIRRTGSGIFTINTDGTGEQRLFADEFDCQFDPISHPSWSPDGPQIVFVRYPDGPTTSDLYIIDASGTGLRASPPTPHSPRNHLPRPTAARQAEPSATGQR